MNVRSTVVLAALLAGGPAAAHDKGGRALGTVESVAADRIVVKTADGHPVAFKVTPRTEFVREAKPATLAEVEAGERVVVTGTKVGDELQAVRVKLGAHRAGH